MSNPQLEGYIKNQRSKGFSDEQLKQALLNRGYGINAVNEALGNQNLSSIPPSSASGNFKGIKNRNPVLVLLLSLFSLGIYNIYWWISTTLELRRNTKSAPSLWFIITFFIPIIGIFFMFYFIWKYCRAINELSGMSSFALFALFLLISPVGIVLAQVELNKKSSAVIL